MSDRQETLRVALVAGTLGAGGAEKQLVYFARALREAGVDVRIYCLTRGEFYEHTLETMNLHSIWIGRFANPLIRLGALTIALRTFRPHVVQSTHFFTNLYVAISGRIWGATAIGAIRNDTLLDMQANGRWGQSLLRLPPVLLTNSYAAKRNAELQGIAVERIHVLPTSSICLPSISKWRVARL